MWEGKGKFCGGAGSADTGQGGVEQAFPGHDSISPGGAGGRLVQNGGSRFCLNRLILGVPVAVQRK